MAKPNHTNLTGPTKDLRFNSNNNLVKTTNEGIATTIKTPAKGRYKTVEEALDAKKKQALFLLKGVDLKALTNQK